MTERKAYETIKRDIKRAIETIRAKSPDAAAYFEQHIVMDENKCTFAYTGDNRFSLTQILTTAQS